MKKNLYKLTFTFLSVFSLISVFAQSNPFIGSWLGKIETSGIQLRIAFHISEKEGIIVTKMDSPDQGSFGNPAHKTTINETNIVIELPLMGARYEGNIKQEEIDGIFYQGGLELPLILARFEGELSAPKRPQTPQAPFPYKEKEVIIKTTNEKVKLSGTITTPEGKGPFPAVVLISGSGPQDRNEELMNHKPFHVLADYLSRNGVIVLRYDDRGVGKSTGDFSIATSFDFADDAEAAWKYLYKQKNVDKSKVGILGHSEGGLIAPIVASKNKDIGFIILMAGPSVPGNVIIPDQQELILRASGSTEKEIKQQTQLNKLIVDFITQNETSSSLQQDLTKKIEEWVKEIGYEIPKTLTVKSFAKQTAQSFTTNWMKKFIVVSPADYIKDVECPVLALFGEKDLQVSTRANEGPMQQLLQHKSNSKVHAFPGLNHLFQTAKTGSPSEYMLIEETISPAFLDYVQKWIVDLK